MTDTLIECHEVVGKIVDRLRLASSSSGAQEVHLEFTDGTAFSLTIEPSTVRKASLISQAEGALQVLKTYTD